MADIGHSCSGLPVVLPDHEGRPRVVPGGHGGDDFNALVDKARAGTLSPEEQGQYAEYPYARTD